MTTTTTPLYLSAEFFLLIMGCEIVLEELASFFLTKFWVGFIFIFFSFFRGLFLFYFFLFNMDFMVRNSVSLLEEKKKKKKKDLF